MQRPTAGVLKVYRRAKNVLPFLLLGMSLRKNIVPVWDGSSKLEAQRAERESVSEQTRGLVSFFGNAACSACTTASWNQEPIVWRVFWNHAQVDFVHKRGPVQQVIAKMPSWILGMLARSMILPICMLARSCPSDGWQHC